MTSSLTITKANQKISWSDLSSVVHQKNYSIDEAYALCLKLAQSHYENFPVASFVIPKAMRPHIAAVYAFARSADDFADEAKYEGVRMAKLKGWEEQLNLCLQNQSSHPIFIALQNTIRTYNIPVHLFFDLLTAFKMDVVVSRYENFDQVLNYCHYSANPVGRIILHIMGYPAPTFLKQSDDICTALQLTNFWQDVSVDNLKNRVYLPQEDMQRFQYTEAELFKEIYNNSFRRLIFFQIERTEELFQRGKSLCTHIPGRLGLELRLTWQGGMAILAKIKECEGNVLSQRPSLRKKDILRILMTSLRKRSFVSSYNGAKTKGINQ